MSWARRLRLTTAGERGRGSFVRTFGLPFQVDPDKVDAKLKEGILTLALQRPEHDKPKRIRVSA